MNICSEDMVLDIKREKKIDSKEEHDEGIDLLIPKQEKKIINPDSMK